MMTQLFSVSFSSFVCKSPECLLNRGCLIKQGSQYFVFYLRVGIHIIKEAATII